jgi:hypothetical protein
VGTAKYKIALYWSHQAGPTVEHTADIARQIERAKNRMRLLLDIE